MQLKTFFSKKMEGALLKLMDLNGIVSPKIHLLLCRSKSTNQTVIYSDILTYINKLLCPENILKSTCGV